MKQSAYGPNKSGRLVQIQTNCSAFVPAPLPPHIELNWELVNLISRADRALSELAGLARNLPNPHLLIRPFIRREAVLSSRIEGTQCSLSDLFAFEGAGTASNAETRFDILEVANYVSALEYGLERLNELPLSNRLIKESHRLLMQGVRGENLLPGEFRSGQNYIGPPGCTIETASYVPPPVPEMTEAMNALEKYIHAPSELPPLVRLALIHYQFEAIHPFLDGNGRIGRLLITLLFCSEKLLPQPLLYLSAFFERHRKEYYALMLAVSQESAWDEWIKFFLRGIADQAQDASIRCTRLQDLLLSYRDKIQSGRSTGLQLRIIDRLFYRPIFSISDLATSLDITARSAQLNVERLMDMRILTEITGRQRYRLFKAIEIMDIVDDRSISMPTDESDKRATQSKN